MRLFLLTICFASLIACTTLKPVQYTHNVKKEVRMPDTLNFDHVSCRIYAWPLAFNGYWTNICEFNDLYSQCMAEKGWRTTPEREK